VDVRAFCYETESEERVRDALALLVPAEVPLEREETRGHHGDRIVLLSARIEAADGVRAVFDALAASPDMDRIRAELPERIDEDCSLFFHLDKQAAAAGTLRLGDGIAVRAKVEAYPATRDRAVENAREAL
jgi:RNA binding exosome subunit